MSDRTNDQRAERARVTLQAYKEVENESSDPDADEDIIDLLVDLHHYLVKYRADIGVTGAPAAVLGMESLLGAAAIHFEAEAAAEKGLRVMP